MNSKETPLEIHGIPINIYAGFWRRLGALFLDIMIILIPLAVYMYINTLGRLFYFYTFLPFQIFAIYYYVYLPRAQGGTPGKLLLDMKIIRIDGRDLDWQSALLRYLPFFVLGLASAGLNMFSLLRADSEIYNELGWAARNQYLAAFDPAGYRDYLWASNLWIFGSVIILLCNKRRRAIHDYIAGTVVVRGQYVNPLREVMEEEEMKHNMHTYIEESPVDPTAHQRYMPGPDSGIDQTDK